MIGRQQQLLRIDFETTPSHEVLAAKLADFDRLVQDADLVILSDYGKGGLAHIATMIERARAAGKRVLVDPKGEDYTRYRGATMLTPNRSRIPRGRRPLAGRGEFAAKAEALRRDLALEALLVTRSEEGMSLFTADGALTIGAQAREVFDVSGAGDTVIATLGVLMAAGASTARRDAHRQRGRGRGGRQARHRRRASAGTRLIPMARPVSADDGDAAPEKFRQQVTARFAVRLHIALILSACFLVGLAVTKALLMAGIGAMWIRYAVALFMAYLAFLLGVRIWLRYAGYDRRILPSRRSSLVDGADLPSFGGGGSSGSSAELPASGGAAAARAAAARRLDSAAAVR